MLAERVKQVEKRLDDKFALEAKVRDETKEALDAKLEVMNNFRTQLDRQSGSFVTWPGVIAAGTFIALVISSLLQVVSHLVTK